MDDIDRALAENSRNSVIEGELDRLKDQLNLEASSEDKPKALEQ